MADTCTVVFTDPATSLNYTFNFTYNAPNLDWTVDSDPGTADPDAPCLASMLANIFISGIQGADQGQAAPAAEPEVTLE